MMRPLLLLLLLLLSVSAPNHSCHHDVVLSGRYRRHEQPPTTQRCLTVFCFSGLPRRVFFLWHAVFLNLSSPPPDMEVFLGANASAVRRAHIDAQRYFFGWWWRVASWKTGSIPLAPFSPSCVGVWTAERLEVSLGWKVEVWRIPMFVGALLLFWNASRLSRHMALYYSCGVSLSLLASLLLLAFLLHRILPFRRGLYALLLFSGASTLAALDLVWRNLETVLVHHQTAAMAYVGVVSSLAFAGLYLGAPRITDRTYNLVQWGLQLGAVVALFASAQIPEVACAVAGGLFIAYNFPTAALMPRVRARWYRWFPKKRRLLTEEEYRATVHEATVKALADLRGFCRSPQCRSWSLVGRLREPGRFASFVEGEEHVIAEEEEAHSQWEMTRQTDDAEMTSDSEDDDRPNGSVPR